MLEFIVLGQIPGTSLTITFNWVLLLVATALMIYDIRHIVQRRKLVIDTDGPDEKVTR